MTLGKESAEVPYPPSSGTMSRPFAPLIVGGLALLAALPLAMAIGAVHATAPGNPERAVARVVALLAGLALLAPIGVLASRRRSTGPSDMSLALLCSAVVALCGIYLYWASSSVLLHADTLIWSEGPFVNDILKFRIGYPMYSAPANLDSFFYPPGAQLLTYGLARLVGMGTSIPAYRVIQLVYAAVAALVATATTLRLLAMARPGRAAALSPAWGAFLTPVLFLAATNALTNPFAHLLHNDGLSLLVCAIGYYLLVRYATTRSVAVLVALALVPAVGFYVKQSLVIWAGLVSGYLLVFDEPRSIRRTVSYAIGAFGLTALGYAAGRMVWGIDFYYWLIADLKDHPFSILRSVQHGLTAWSFFAVGIVGGMVLIGRQGRRVAGLWVVAMLLLAQEAYTSGIAWMLNHMGPGSLLAVIWFSAALMAAWPRTGRHGRSVIGWTRAALATALVLLTFSGLGFVRIPVRALPRDIDRYVAAIEREFVGQDAARVLLDAGTWVYLPGRVVMKDRSAAVGDLGSSGLGDFSGLLSRIRGHYYQRILVRSLNRRDFGYDHSLWARSSGIHAALLERYREVRRIPAVEGMENGTPFLREISVLEPKP